MQLALALSASLDATGLPTKRRRTAAPRQPPPMPPPPAAPQSTDGFRRTLARLGYVLVSQPRAARSQSSSDFLRAVEGLGYVVVSSAGEKCFGCCFAFSEGSSGMFVGAPRSRPDRSAPDGGWGYTTCCSKPAHFDCLGEWLRVKREERLEGRDDVSPSCPLCKEVVSCSTTRMLRAEAGN